MSIEQEGQPLRRKAPTFRPAPVSKKVKDLLGKRDRPAEQPTAKEMQVLDVKNIIKNPDHFTWIFGIELGYHLPPRQFITWPYIFKVIAKEKLLIKASDINLTTPVPKIDQLSVKRIWPKVKENLNILRHMPLFGEDRLPPRLYMFQVIKALDEGLFNQILREANESRRQIHGQDKKMVTVDSDIYMQLRRVFSKIPQATRPVSKRVNTMPVRRRRRDMD